MNERFFKLILISLMSVYSLIGSDKQRLIIVQNNISQYVIIIPKYATEIESEAANELQKYLLKASGVSIPIMMDTLRSKEYEILIGNTNRINEVFPDLDLTSLEEDGFTIQTKENKLIILGGKRKGTLYGVYTFLEDFIGCRKFSAKVEFVPSLPRIEIPEISKTQIPIIQFREAHFLDAMDRRYSDWHKLNSLSDQEDNWGMWVHTFERLIPAKNYFKLHPEYFSILGGRRIPNGQLCLSNQDVYSILVSRLRQCMNEKPQAHYWSVSQNDNYNECQCENCRTLNAKYGSSSGTMIAFVNRIANEFPDKTISTLAYQYTRSAPMQIEPGNNVNIMLCSIECNRSKPIATDPSGASFRKDIEDWGKLTNNILMWDYVVQFRNLVSPFPNLRILQPNIKFFVKNNVRMMFQQGCGANVAEFSEFRSYLISKLLWNPDIDINVVMNDFLNGYYGKAGSLIRKYIDIMHDALEASGDNLNIYGYPYDAINSYLTPPLINTYSSIFEEAEKVVGDEPEVLQRIRTARLPLEFAMLDISLRNVNKELTYFDTTGNEWRIKPNMQHKLDRFVSIAKESGIERLEEGGTSPDEYRISIEKQLKVSVKNNLAFGKSVILNTRHSEKYPVGGGVALTNGLHGPNDYHCNWLGFEDENMEAIIDLGKIQEINKIKTNFLQQYYAWIWLPLKVDFSTSQDGKYFTEIASFQNKVPDTVGGVFTKEFNVVDIHKSARYIKVIAKSRLKCPDWHIGAGGKAWIFIDEIVVE